MAGEGSFELPSANGLRWSRGRIPLKQRLVPDTVTVTHLCQTCLDKILKINNTCLTLSLCSKGSGVKLVCTVVTAACTVTVTWLEPLSVCSSHGGEPSGCGTDSGCGAFMSFAGSSCASATRVSLSSRKCRLSALRRASVGACTLGQVCCWLFN